MKWDSINMHCIKWFEPILRESFKPWSSYSQILIPVVLVLKKTLGIKMACYFIQFQLLRLVMARPQPPLQHPWLGHLHMLNMHRCQQHLKEQWRVEPNLAWTPLQPQITLLMVRITCSAKWWCQNFRWHSRYSRSWFSVFNFTGLGNYQQQESSYGPARSSFSSDAGSYGNYGAAAEQANYGTSYPHGGGGEPFGRGGGNVSRGYHPYGRWSCFMLLTFVFC